MSINTDRLRQLAHCAADGNWSEFHMSIPARPDHDADLVLSAAADEIDRLRAENAELSSALRKIAEGNLGDRSGLFVFVVLWWSRYGTLGAGSSSRADWLSMTRSSSQA